MKILALNSLRGEKVPSGELWAGLKPDEKKQKQ